jgi:hypothetical protein
MIPGDQIVVVQKIDTYGMPGSGQRVHDYYSDAYTLPFSRRFRVARHGIYSGTNRQSDDFARYDVAAGVIVSGVDVVGSQLLPRGLFSAQNGTEYSVYAQASYGDSPFFPPPKIAGAYILNGGESVQLKVSGIVRSGLRLKYTSLLVLECIA